MGLTDTRNPKSLRHPFSAMLTLIVYGLICGAGDVKAIWHKCGPLDQNQRRAIGLTKKNKKTGLLIMPGYGAINDIVNRVCPVELARHLNAWLTALTANSEHLPKSLALDGELPVAQRLLDKDAASQLAGALVTGDALNAQKKRRSLSPPTAVITSSA